MKKINFLIKIGREGKLQEVEPSEEIKSAYLQRSTESNQREWTSNTMSILKSTSAKQKRRYTQPRDSSRI